MENQAITVKELENIRTLGLKALSEELGPIGMMKFIQMYSDGKGDYTTEKKEILDNVSIEDFDEFINNIEDKK